MERTLRKAKTGQRHSRAQSKTRFGVPSYVVVQIPAGEERVVTAELRYDWVAQTPTRTEEARDHRGENGTVGVRAKERRGGRKVDNLVRALGLSGMSKSQPSQLCQDVDERVQTFLGRPLTGEWLYLWLDATYVKVRDAGRTTGVERGAARCVRARRGAVRSGAILDGLRARPRAARSHRRPAGHPRCQRGAQAGDRPGPRGDVSTLPGHS